MKVRGYTFLAVGVACSLAVAQQAPQANKPQEKKDHIEGARELFYLAVAKKDTLPPIKKIAGPRPAPVTTSAQGQTQTPATPTPIPTVIVAPDRMAAKNLGLRYNLVLVNQQNGRSENVDADRIFHPGECFALDFQSNRSGYLYVLAKQSSGQWLPLLPSEDMADEKNIIDPGQNVRVPKSYCFEVNNPPGSETLFVVLSRDPKDFSDLTEGIKRQNSAPSAPAPVRRPMETVQYADLNMDKTVQQMRQQFGTRDIAIRKVSQPVSSQEPAHSVYVVNTSDTPSSSVVTQIEVKHR